MTKRALFLIVFMLMAAYSFAQNIHQRYIFIQGTSIRTDHYEFFLKNFTMEAGGAGYIVTGNRGAAAHTLNFNVGQNSVPDNYQYVLKLSLIRNEDNFEITTLEFFYNHIDEMYEWTRTLFQNATLYIPLFTTEELNAAQDIFQSWKNKWIYLRASFDYPITFYLLKGEGLLNGVALYNDSNDMSLIDHKVIAMPGATVGAEFQILNFFSLELNLQISWGDTRSNQFINTAAGLELKFPIKFSNIALVPYGALIYHLNVSQIFTQYPPLAFGAGIQLCTKAGNLGAFFIDVNYTFSVTDAVMHNPYLSLPPPQQLFPKPAVIHYDRSIIGIKVGYKFGLFDR